ncbi:unnamed protein product [Nyctereutes procyonoides]|uniref:(raccoon dog) hypothetical protein n=1 Tax=Nyctereutes procyonoides TaxID=34880 RepID=A0A811ZER0_NYCPR|nr:unnamed protein product [Nyctereutes procyonoides]
MDTLEAVPLKQENMNAQACGAGSGSCGCITWGCITWSAGTCSSRASWLLGCAFQDHPQLSSFLNSQEREALGYLNSLEVEELGLARLGYKIKFYFGRNPYFQNKVVSLPTPLQGLPGHDLQSLSPGSPDNSRSFFGWFSNHSSIEWDKTVEIISEALWPHPLQYYLMSEGPGPSKGRRVGRAPGRPRPADPALVSPRPPSDLRLADQAARLPLSSWWPPHTGIPPSPRDFSYKNRVGPRASSHQCSALQGLTPTVYTLGTPASSVCGLLPALPGPCAGPWPFPAGRNVDTQPSSRRTSDRILKPCSCRPVAC